MAGKFYAKLSSTLLTLALALMLVISCLGIATASPLSDVSTVEAIPMERCETITGRDLDFERGICAECTVLFDELVLDGLCSENCYDNDYYRGCVAVLSPTSP